MTPVKRFLDTICDILVLFGVLGLIVPSYSLAKDRGSQQEVGNDRQDNGDDEDNSNHAGDGKERIERCLRAFSQGKKPRKNCPSGGSSSGIAKADFNGDGFADLAIGVPGEETPTGVVASGAVNVIYGSANGLTATDSSVPASQFWSQNASGIPGVSEEDDNFGSALAAGDFNGDGFSDLAIGVENEDITVNGLFGPTTYTEAGAVVVIYGSPSGLTTSDPNVPPAAAFNFTMGGRSDKLQKNTQLGSSLSWGDFNGDGIGDLAIGAPGFSTFPAFGAGAVWVLFGSRNEGLTTHGNQFWTQDDLGLGSSLFDFFGSVLAAGDFNGDGRSELAIGMPSEDFLQVADAGAVAVLIGSQDGLTKVGAQFLISLVFPSD